jgi:TRAP-type C4-dicarboxylate transport system substrate-binding protein
MRPALPALLAAAALAAGCGAASTDRAGGSTDGRPTVLRFAQVNFAPEELEPFADEVRRLSDGDIRIRFLTDWAADETGVPELHALRDVAAGKADVGWAGSRAFDLVGDDRFDPLHAPLLIQSLALEDEVLRDDSITGPMLDSLGDLGVRGIAILPGPLRRPLGERPLRAASDWRGVRVGYSGGGQVHDSLVALGAEPVFAVAGPAPPGTDGFESHIGAIAGNGYDHRFGNLTGDVVLWPRPIVLFAGPHVTDEQLEVLRQAADRSRPATVAWIRATERERLAMLCGRGITIVGASPADVDSLRKGFAPVYDALRAGDGTRAALDAITGVAAGTVPDSVRCAAAPPARVGAFPEGTYRLHLTRRDAQRADPDSGVTADGTLSFTLTFEDGRFELIEHRPDGTTAIGMEGTYSVYRDRLVATASYGDTVKARWSADGDFLRFRDVEPAGGPEDFTWGTRAWRRVP